MGSATSDAHHVASTVERSVKVLVVGAYGVGKTTLIGAVSEIPTLRTEEQITTASVGVDPRRQGKETTTVAMDFGRVTLGTGIALYLFGTPGQKRFWDLWAGLAEGAVGALVIVDTRRLEESFDVLDQLEEHTDLPVAVVVNQFPGAADHSVDDVRGALDLAPGTPVVTGDMRQRDQAVSALVALAEHAVRRRAAASAAA